MSTSVSVAVGVQSSGMPSERKLTADTFLMVNPAHLDACMCPDNAFTDLVHGVDHQKALDQHLQVVELLRSLGKEVEVFSGRSADDTFCNNIFATNHNKQLIIGNMFYPARQMEGEREDIREWFTQKGYELVEVSSYLQDPAELTGMLIIDHATNVGYCGLSNRCTADSAAVFQQLFGLAEVITFPISIYHTNVGLSILAGRVVVICPEMFLNPNDAQMILNRYPQHIVLSEYQMASFSGNVLAVTENDMVMSSRGFEALSAEQKHQLKTYGFDIHHVDLSEIEKSGGSMRCLLAEVF